MSILESDTTLAGVQRSVDAWITGTGGGYFDPLTNMAVLTEEVGEVARIMAREYGAQTWRRGAPVTRLADELADVLWVVAALANQTGVDLTEAFKANLAKKNERDAQRFVPRRDNDNDNN